MVDDLLQQRLLQRLPGAAPQFVLPAILGDHHSTQGVFGRRSGQNIQGLITHNHRKVPSFFQCTCDFQLRGTKSKICKRLQLAVQCSEEILNLYVDDSFLSTGFNSDRTGIVSKCK